MGLPVTAVIRSIGKVATTYWAWRYSSLF